MKKIALFTVFACIMVILQGCAKDMPTEENKEAVQENSNAYHKIDAKKAKEMMDAGKVTIVDVRTQQEYREKLIPDAVLVPNETIEDAVLILHCRTGVRSKQASDKLVQMGYRNVYDFGGINDWPYDTVSE